MWAWGLELRPSYRLHRFASTSWCVCSSVQSWLFSVLVRQTWKLLFHVVFPLFLQIWRHSYLRFTVTIFFCLPFGLFFSFIIFVCTLQFFEFLSSWYLGLKFGKLFLLISLKYSHFICFLWPFQFIYMELKQLTIFVSELFRRSSLWNVYGGCQFMSRSFWPAGLRH